MSAPDLCRELGISDATFYSWRRKYGGMEVAASKRLKALEAENAELKKMLTEQMMDVATLKEMPKKTTEGLLEGEGCGLGHERKELIAAASLCVGRDRPVCLSAQVEASGCHWTAGQDEGVGLGATAVRLSPPANPSKA